MAHEGWYPSVHRQTNRPHLKVGDRRDVYLVQGAIGGPIKIGVAEDVPRRLAELQSYSPIPLRVLATIRHGDIALEAALHRRFVKHRLHGEWFDNAPEMLDYLTGLLEEAEVPAGTRDEIVRSAKRTVVSSVPVSQDEFDEAVRIPEGYLTPEGVRLLLRLAKRKLTGFLREAERDGLASRDFYGARIYRKDDVDAYVSHKWRPANPSPTGESSKGTVDS